jgi:addiction module HigA family antidote
MERIPTITPGEILSEEFLIPFNLTAYRLAKETNISATRIGEIINGKRKITVDTALRFSTFFGNSPEFWIGIQNEYDIREEKQKLSEELKAIHSIKELISA